MLRGIRAPNRTGSAARALDSAPWLAGWAPGGGESVFGDGTGKRLKAGGRVVLQVHYNLREGRGPDDTAVRLRMMPGTADLEQLQTMLLVAPVELPCLPDERGPLCDRSASMLDLVSRFGQASGRTVSGLQLLCDGSLVAPPAGPTQSCDRRVSSAIDVRAVAGHMHLLGRSIQVDLVRRDGSRRRLLDRPVWDFDDQGATPLRTPATVRPGDVLRVTCTHDAGLRSLVPELEDEQPRYVTWGEGTLRRDVSGHGDLHPSLTPAPRPEQLALPIRVEPRPGRHLLVLCPGPGVAHGLGERSRSQTGGGRPGRVGRHHQDVRVAGAPQRERAVVEPLAEQEVAVHPAQRGSRWRDRVAHRRQLLRHEKGGGGLAAWKAPDSSRSSRPTIQDAMSRTSMTCAGASAGPGASTSPPRASRSTHQGKRQV